MSSSLRYPSFRLVAPELTLNDHFHRPWRIHTAVACERQQRQLRWPSIFLAGQVNNGSLAAFT